MSNKTKDDLKREIRNQKAQLSTIQNQKSQYNQIAQDIGYIYDWMLNDKRMIIQYKNNLNSFYHEDFFSFKGSNHIKVYKPSVKAVLDNYQSLISDIDYNLDRLNDERRKYENLSYSCDGLIGDIYSAINSLNRTLQNWVN